MQSDLEEISKGDGITMLCGRYEGVDQRILDYYQMEEVSLGDFVLMGGGRGTCHSRGAYVYYPVWLEIVNPSRMTLFKTDYWNMINIHYRKNFLICPFLRFCLGESQKNQ